MGPPIFRGTLLELASTPSGQMTFVGILITLIGIVVVAKAGRSKQSELSEGAAKVGIAEFDLQRGLAIAVFSGVMSGCFAWGLDAGQPIRTLTLAAGTDPLSQGLPVLCIVLAGGFTTNFLWCLFLIPGNRTAGEFVGKPTRQARLAVGTTRRQWNEYMDCQRLLTPQARAQPRLTTDLLPEVAGSRISIWRISKSAASRG
jgi:hypothetical protein